MMAEASDRGAERNKAANEWLSIHIGNVQLAADPADDAFNT
jgi:hypothetical protein